MSSEHAKLGIYWGPRAQSLQECAELCLNTISLLRSAGYPTFFQLGRTRREGLKHPIEESQQALELLLAKGINRTDVGRHPIPELGFRLGAWSGGSDAESYSLSITCGCYSSRVSNVVLLALPSTGAYSRGSSPESARLAFEGLVGLWRPEIAALWVGDNLRWDGKRRFAKDMKCILRYPPVRVP